MANGKWLVTGCAGFCGSTLVDLLVAQGCQVFGVDVTAVDAHPAQHSGAAYEPIQADLADASAVRRLVADVEPDYIAHLAALTNPAAPLAALYEANVYGTVHLLDAVKAAVPACMVLIAGSSAQYGLTSPDENPITEAQSFRPITHYAVTKATQASLPQGNCSRVIGYLRVKCLHRMKWAQ